MIQADLIAELKAFMRDDLTFDPTIEDIEDIVRLCPESTHLKQDWEVMKTRYGLSGEPPQSFDEVGKRHGMHRNYAHFRVRRGFRWIRVYLSRLSTLRNKPEPIGPRAPEFVGHLTVNAYNRLVNRGIRSLPELRECSADDLMGIRGFGPHALREVRGMMAKHGLHLRGEEPGAV